MESRYVAGSRNILESNGFSGMTFHVPKCLLNRIHESFPRAGNGTIRDFAKRRLIVLAVFTSGSNQRLASRAQFSQVLLQHSQVKA